MADVYWLLQNCDLLSQLNPQDIQRLETTSKTRKFKRGEPIYLPSEAADGVLVVVQGRVKLCHVTPEGKQSILNFIDAGEVFGELSLVGSLRRDEFAEAAEATTLVVIPKSEMVNLMVRYHNLQVGVTRLIGLRRQRVERRLRNLLFRSNRERVVHLLIEMSEKYGRQTENGLELNIKLSHQEIASLIGSTRETVTVMLGQLQSEGKIKIARRRITILDLGKLRHEVSEFLPEPQPQQQPQRFGNAQAQRPTPVAQNRFVPRPT